MAKVLPLVIGVLLGAMLTFAGVNKLYEGAPNYGEMVKKAPAWLEVNPLVEAGILDISADTYRVSIGAAEAFAGLGLLYGSVSGTEHCAHACALLSFVIFVGASLTDFLLAKKNSEAASPVAVPATIAALSFLRAFVFAPSGGKKKKE